MCVCMCACVMLSVCVCWGGGGRRLPQVYSRVLLPIAMAIIVSTVSAASYRVYMHVQCFSEKLPPKKSSLLELHSQLQELNQVLNTCTFQTKVMHA